MQRLTADRPETQSLDGLAQNLTRLQDLFPEAFTEGRLDFDVLRQLLGDQIDDRPEKYGLSWNGKARARRHALTPTRATLRPDKDSSVDWDSTQNLMIEGDNLEVLKLLQRSYAGKVKLIYIDPPYNTGKDFVYPDDYTDSLRNYQELTGQLEEGRRVSSNTESSGRFHTDWLNMMYPRLKLARELLRDDGLIFISIDDTELSNINLLMENVFGIENFISTLAVSLNPKGRQLAPHFATSHEYVIVYSKNYDVCGFTPNTTDTVDKSDFPLRDESGSYRLLPLRNTNKKFNPSNRPNLYYPLYIDANSGKVSTIEDGSGISVMPIFGDGSSAVWRWSKGKANVQPDELLGREVAGRLGSRWDVFQKDYYSDERTKKLPSLWLSQDVGSTDAANAELRDMGLNIFDTPKPAKLIRRLASFVGKDDIILDFFSGSGTTGHAVMSQNAADNGSRQFILVQLPEPLDPAKAEQKTAADFCDSLGVPRNIAELTKERLRRAGAKVKAENPMFAGDTGFRVFKLDSSNLTGWDSEAARADLEEALLSAEDNIKPGRTDADVLYEVLLKLGLPLTTPIEERTVAGLPVQMVGGGVLLACLARRITAAQVPELGRGMADWLEAENAAGEAHVLFLDSAFENDTAKLNLSKYLAQRADTLGRNWVVRSL